MDSSDLRGLLSKFPPDELSLSSHSGRAEVNERGLVKVKLKECWLLLGAFQRNVCAETGRRQADLNVMQWRLSGLKQTIKDIEAQIRIYYNRNTALQRWKPNGIEDGDLIDSILEGNPVFQLVKRVLQTKDTSLESLQQLFRHGQEWHGCALVYIDERYNSSRRSYDVTKEAAERAIEQLGERNRREKENITDRYNGARLRLEHQRNLERANQSLISRLSEDLVRSEIQRNVLQKQLDAIECNLGNLQQKFLEEEEKYFELKLSETEYRNQLSREITRGTARVNTMDKEIEKMIAEKGVKQGYIQELTEKMTDLTCTNHQMETEYYELFVKKSRVQMDLLNVEQHLERESHNALTLSQEVMDLDRMQDHLAGVNSSIQRTLGPCHDQNELRSLNEVKQTLENQLNNMKSEHDAYKHRADVLMEAVTDSRERSHYLAMEKKEICSKIELLDSRTNSLTIEVENLLAQRWQLNDFCSKALDRTQAVLSRMESTLAVYLAEKNTLGNELLSKDRSTNHCFSAGKESDLEEKIESLSNKYCKITRHSNGIKQEFTETTNKLGDLKNEIDELRRRKILAKKKNGDIKLSIFCRQSEIDSLRKQLNKLQERKGLLLTQIENRTNGLKENDKEEFDLEILRLQTEKQKLEEKTKQEYLNLRTSRKKALLREKDLADEIVCLKNLQRNTRLRNNKRVSTVQQCEAVEQEEEKRQPARKIAGIGERPHGKTAKRQRASPKADSGLPGTTPVTVAQRKGAPKKRFPARTRAKRSLDQN